MDTTYITPADLIGKTIHYVSGKRSGGVWNVITSSQSPDNPGWALVKDDRGRIWTLLLADCYSTAEEARAVVRSRRKPRTPRTPQAAIPGGIVQALQLGAMRFGQDA